MVLQWPRTIFAFCFFLLKALVILLLWSAQFKRVGLPLSFSQGGEGFCVVSVKTILPCRRTWLDSTLETGIYGLFIVYFLPSCAGCRAPLGFISCNSLACLGQVLLIALVLLLALVVEELALEIYLGGLVGTSRFTLLKLLRCWLSLVQLLPRTIVLLIAHFIHYFLELEYD